MISLKRIALLFFAVGILSCSQEVIEPAQQVTGKYALDDGSGQTKQYVEFSKGMLTVYESNDAYPLAEDYIWDVDGKAFSKKSEQKYSIEGTSLHCSGPVSGEIKKDGDKLTIGRKTYMMLKGLIDTPYSTIKPEKLSYEIPYLESAYSIPVEVENPIKSGIMSASSSEAWISGVKWENGTVSYKVSSTQQQRTGTIVLHYTHSKEVRLKISQVQQTFIRLEWNNRTVDYGASSQVLTYTVDNPTAGATLRVTSNANWVYGIEVREKEIIFYVRENNSGNSRTAQLTLSYPGAADVVFNLTQSWASSALVLTPLYTQLDYKGGSGSFDVEIQNPRQGVTVSAQSQVEWITGVTVSGTKVSYTVAENNSGATRKGIIKLTYGDYAKTEFIVSQSGNPDSPFKVGYIVDDGGMGVVFWISENGQSYYLVSVTEIHNQVWQESYDWCKSYGDGSWDMPTIDELTLLHNAFSTVNTALRNSGYTVLSSSNCYWSQTVSPAGSNYRYRERLDTGNIFHTGNDEYIRSRMNYTRAIKYKY